ncbi:uncharacterized protein PV06_02902 [Exophiala oligosperma]|uniref:Uncharacterized protein n=1 Tax=Exophiala oligosperma TaxID=215243 RepID=A0A0D2AXB5_9EURO|nr:uncharacterized protein PV06_02902 [Exophiala oligosperma]KIW44431.1 hypothetical protein PV06_02902 [Exophiala oligosperma]
MAELKLAPELGSEMVESVTMLPPVQRHITGHNSGGKSIYLDSPPVRYWPVPNAGGTGRSYAVGSVPAKLAADIDLKSYLQESGPTSSTGQNIVPYGTGANLLVVDLIPGAKSQLHRTVSIDFSICVMGEVLHELDSGEVVRLLPGVCLPSLRVGLLSGCPNCFSVNRTI